MANEKQRSWRRPWTMGGGGASSWNDLKDKPFYTETVEEVILDGELEEGDGGFFASCMIDRQPIDGEQLTVIWNGEMNTVSFTYDAENDEYTATLPDDGLLCSYFTDPDWEYTVDAPVAATVKVLGCGETVHTIDPKYLPCDLMFKVGCTGLAHPKFNPANMTKPTIVSGSLEAVLEKLANGEIPVVKVQYMGVWDKTNSIPLAYGGEFTCDTWLYTTDVMFAHDIPSRENKYTVQITMNTDDPTSIKMAVYCGMVGVSVIPIS